MKDSGECAIADYALTFTSFDNEERQGGWQVMDEWPAPEARQRDLLLRGVRTHFPGLDGIPPFPTPLERRALPRRMEFRSTGDGRTAIWHTVPAGKDASGRPGNLFVTAALFERHVWQVWRPIDLWGSPTFPTPFGPTEVNAGRGSSSDGIRPGSLADPGAVAAFLLPDAPHEPYRAAVLPRVLDAVDAALAGDGPHVTLRVDSSEEGALWIASLCAFQKMEWSARLSWSTWEDERSLRDQAVRSMHLVAVPRDDHSSGDTNGRVVIDIQAELEASRSGQTPDEADGGPWLFGATEVPVRGCSTAAFERLNEGPEDLVKHLWEVRQTPTEDPPELRRQTPWARAVSTPASSPSLPAQPVKLAPSLRRPTAAVDARSWPEVVHLLLRKGVGEAGARDDALQALSALGLDSSGAFLSSGVIDPRYRQDIAVLVAHAIGVGDLQRQAAAPDGLFAALDLLVPAADDSETAYTRLASGLRFVASVFIASILLDVRDGPHATGYERREASIWRLLDRVGFPFSDIWRDVNSLGHDIWGDAIPRTRTVREFVATLSMNHQGRR